MTTSKTQRPVWMGIPLALKIVLKNQIGRLKLKRRHVDRAIHKTEYRVFSQHREDGIIDYLLDSVGVKNGVFVEFGFWPQECNCLNLGLNRNFSGVFIDAAEENCLRARAAFDCLGKSSLQVTNSFVTAENINQLISDSNISGEIDVLSIDIDGNDYWLWSAIDVVNPRIVVVEYNATFGAERAVSVPYHPEFNRHEYHPSGFYHGASLAALQHLGSEKGYKLVGCDFTGVNAFFVRNDLVTPDLELLSVEQAFMENRGRVKYKKLTTTAQFEQIQDLPLIEVSRH